MADELQRWEAVGNIKMQPNGTLALHADAMQRLAQLERERDEWKDSAERHHADSKGLMRCRESLEIQLENAKGIIVRQEHELGEWKKRAEEAEGVIREFLEMASRVESAGGSDGPLPDDVITSFAHTQAAIMTRMQRIGREEAFV